MTGRREAGAYSILAPDDVTDNEQAQRLAMAVFAPDWDESPGLGRSLAREIDRARTVRAAKRLVWARFLAPYVEDKGLGKRAKRNLTANEQRAKLGAIRRARIVCLLLDGQGVAMPSSKLSPILKALGVEITNGKRSLAGELARLA